MTPSDSNPKLPLWIFVVTDVVLISAAALIRAEAKQPLSTEVVFAIVGCLVVGAMVGLVPIIAHYERVKNDILDDRQRALESLARTLNAAAEQISIAASGFNEIADLTQKNLRHAEQLPHKLQEKISEFQAQLTDANETEKEELEKEVAELRAAESERLEATATKIAKAVTEFAKLEAATQQHLTAANDALGKLSFGAAGAIGKAQAAAEQAFAQARTEAARGLGETAGAAAKTIESAKTAALSEIDAKLAAVATALVEKVAREAGKSSASVSADVTPPSSSAAESTEPATPPKRPRKRREESGAVEEASVATEVVPAKTSPADEPPPVPTEKIAEVAPIAPHTKEPFEANIAPEASTPTPAAVAAAAEPTATETPRATRKRAPKKTEVAEETKSEPKLELDETPSRPSAEVAERVLSSDGATRLLVTAYIGIGNRLFIRGQGPGLSWDKGVPLQFVSIGKWRWETNDAASAIEFKLYKNDETECAALGTQKLDPGYQQEVTAGF